MSHVSWLSDQFCIYKLKLRFLKRGSPITDETPSPLPGQVPEDPVGPNDGPPRQ